MDTRYRCDHCQHNFQEHEDLYVCLDCEAFHLCETCFHHPQQHHPHFLVRESAQLQDQWQRMLAWYTSPATILTACFQRFAKRPLFGIPTPLPKEDQSTHTAHTYSQQLNTQEAPHLFFCEHVEDTKTLSSQHIHWLTYAGVEQIAKALGAALTTIAPEGTLIGICAPHAPHCFLADLACTWYGYPFVLLPTNVPTEQLAFILEDTQLTHLICTQALWPTFQTLNTNHPSLQHVILIDEHSSFPTLHTHLTPTPKPNTLHHESPLTHHSMSSLIQYGSAHPLPTKDTPEEALSFLVYTSGSTGQPKGVTFNNQRWVRRFCKPSYAVGGITVRFLPFSSESARASIYVGFIHGRRFGFHTQQGFEDLFETFQLFKPTHISSVPRLWNQLYTNIQAAIVARTSQHPTQSRATIEAEVFASFRHLLGGRTRYLLSGGAPIAANVIDTMERCFECLMLDGYGITETGGLTHNDTLKSHVEYKLRDVPSLGYYSTDRPSPRGELCVKKPDMFSGYWREEDNIGRLEEGWFYTGDIVEEYAPRRIRVIDRKNHIYKLAQGVFVAPESLETLYCTSPLIEQMYIHCAPHKHHLVAIVVPHVSLLAATLSDTTQQMTRQAQWQVIEGAQEDANRAIMKELATIAASSQRALFEQPRALHLTPIPFTTENQQLTRNAKQHRAHIAEHYKEELNALYTQLSPKNMRPQLISLIRSLLPHTQTQLLDSLAAVQLHTLLLDQFQLHIPVKWLLQAPTTEDIVDFIEHGMCASQDDPIAQMKLDLENFQPKHATSLRPPNQGQECIFLTGATGFLGSHLLTSLLQQNPKAKLICLVRETASETPLQRIERVCNAHAVWDTTWKDRLECIQGDLTKPMLGLSEEAFLSLSRQLTSIVHNGALVHHVLPYKALRASNVLATATLLDLAQRSSCQTFHYISSTSAIPTPTKGHNTPCQEQWLSFCDEQFALMRDRTGYSQSKYIAEGLVQKAHTKGLHCIIYRPGYIAPHSQTGVYNERDTFTRIIAACVQQRSIPLIPAEHGLRMLPVDITAQFIAQYVFPTYPSAPSGIHHVTTPHQLITWRSLFSELQAFIPESEVTHYKQWWAQLHTPEAPTAPIHHMIASHLPTEHTHPGYETSALTSFLATIPVAHFVRPFLKRLISSTRKVPT